MKNSKTVILLFLLVALVQLYVPAKMIFDKEAVLNEGNKYKFETVPIDPNDPFRGKYITLGFKENGFDVKDAMDWNRGETVYVTVNTGADGFAKISSISKEKPRDELDFIKAKVGFISYGSNYISINFPFDRYYMEESKAPVAEQTFRRSQNDSTQITYAVVHVKNGDAVLKNVMIGGVAIEEWVKDQNE